MIIQICGTNASGKTTIARKLLAISSRTPVNVTGAFKLIGHDLTLSGQKTRLLGPYREDGKTTSHGMDKLGGTAEWQYDFIKKQLDESPVVIYEGMRVANHKRTAPFITGGIPFHIVLLTTPMPVVLESLVARRAAKGMPPLEDTKHIHLNYKRSVNFANAMEQLGASVHKVSRDNAVEKILEILLKPTLLPQESEL